MTFEAESLFSLAGKTAVLTGASGFLGRTFARALFDNGARVIALGRSERIRALEKEWRNEYGAERVSVSQVDMYDLGALDRTLDAIASENDTIDILVNNAYELGPSTGFNIPEGSLENAGIDLWMRNLTGGIVWPAVTTQKIGARMCARKSGSIINIATMYAQVAPSPRLYEGTSFLNPPGYSVAKAGLVALTRYTASFWGSYGVRANAILPGPFSNTESDGPNSVKENDPFLTKLSERTSLGRIGQPSELAGALLYLASSASSFVTGQSLVVDGGWTVT